MNAGIFFERDGVLNRVRVEQTHQMSPLRLDEFFLNGDALEPLRRLKQAGFTLIATTNQPGLSTGWLTRHEMDRMHSLLRQRFRLDDILVCPHDAADMCNCRKPKPGLFQEAAFKWHLDMDRSFVVSDKWQDAVAAHYVGCRSFLIKSPWSGNGHHDYIIPDLNAMADKILELQTQRHLFLMPC